MISESLNLWSNGAVTLPKEWRDRYKTKHFLARENDRGYLEIIPILDIEYYETPDGSCGLRFPMGMDMEEFVERFERTDKRVRKEERKTSRKRRKR